MKKILVLILALALLLCGCGGNVDSFDPVKERPEIELPEPIINTDLPGNAETQPPQVEVTEPQPLQVLVQDQYSEVYDHPYIDDSYCVHVPQFLWDGSSELIVNENILYDHMQVFSQNTYDPNVPMFSAAYSMGQANGFASVVTCFSNIDYDYVTYSIFHLNATTGLEATDDEILAAYGYTRDTFYAEVKQVMEQMFEEGHANIKEISSADYYNSVLAEHLSDENIQKARPYIDEAGQLCFVAKYYTFAGAGYFNNRLCLSSEDHYPTPRSITCSEHG